MEKDDEVKGISGTSYTTEFRQYDPRVGRWLSIDPKATSFESPYVSMGNKPILMNDKLGDTVTVSINGQEVVTIETPSEYKNFDTTDENVKIPDDFRRITMNTDDLKELIRKKGEIKEAYSEEMAPISQDWLPAWAQGVPSWLLTVGVQITGEFAAAAGGALTYSVLWFVPRGGSILDAFTDAPFLYFSGAGIFGLEGGLAIEAVAGFTSLGLNDLVKPENTPTGPYYGVSMGVALGSFSWIRDANSPLIGRVVYEQLGLGIGTGIDIGVSIGIGETKLLMQFDESN